MWRELPGIRLLELYFAYGVRRGLRGYSSCSPFANVRFLIGRLQRWCQ